MATKKITEEEVQELQAEPAKETPKSEWDENVPVLVPRKPKGEEQQFYVCVNDRRFAIPANGKVQKMPKPIAKILQDAIDAEYQAEDYADNIPNESAEQLRQL